MSVPDDLHARFDAWLQDGAPDDPPRDAAIHASVCAECQRKVAALDGLLFIDLGLAPLPPSRTSVAPGGPWHWTVARSAAAAGVGVVALISGVLLAPTLVPRAGADGTPQQQVLGATGTPLPTASPASTRSEGGSASATPTASPTATGTPSTSEAVAPSPPALTPPPVVATPRPVVTTRPTASPSASPTVSATASPSATPAPTPTPTDTPSPTPTATPTPTPEPTPLP